MFGAAGGSAFVITSVPQYAPVYAKANTVSRRLKKVNSTRARRVHLFFTRYAASPSVPAL